MASSFSRRQLLIGGAAAATSVGGLLVALSATRQPSPAAVAATSTPSPAASGWSYARLENPARTEVRDAAGSVIAVFTDKARTVRIEAGQRTFAEPQFTKAKIITTSWVRLAPYPWQNGSEKASWFKPWLERSLASTEPDALEIAFQYVYSAKVVRNAKGLQIGGDAAFGPLSDTDRDGRAENTDFYDYLGIPWTFPDAGKKTPKRDRLHCLDCSGYLRMVYGYRMGFPLLGTNEPGDGLPRRALAIAAVGPGVQLMPNTGKPVRNLSSLQAGDMVFFHGVPEISSDGLDNEDHIEHSGIYLGIDDRGHHRFISSRTGANGPTMGDTGGEAILDGTGHFAVKLRTARRI